jgi:hypothetical protein
MNKKTTPKTLVPSAPPPTTLPLPHPSVLGTVDFEAYFIEKCLVSVLYSKLSYNRTECLYSRWLVFTAPFLNRKMLNLFIMHLNTRVECQRNDCCCCLPSLPCLLCLFIQQAEVKWIGCAASINIRKCNTIRLCIGLNGNYWNALNCIVLQCILVYVSLLYMRFWFIVMMQPTCNYYYNRILWVMFILVSRIHAITEHSLPISIVLHLWTKIRTANMQK